LHLGLNTLYN